MVTEVIRYPHTDSEPRNCTGIWKTKPLGENIHLVIQ